MKSGHFIVSLLLLVVIQISRAVPGDVDLSLIANADKEINCMAMQPDGKTLVGGDFSVLGGVPRNRLARLNANGTMDSDFDPNVNGVVHCVAVQSDGKILFGGDFSTVKGTTRNGIARVNANGTLDTLFDPNVNGGVQAIVVQPNGRIIISGEFTTVGTVTHNRVARLNADGTLDTAFTSDVNGTVYSAALQADGKLVIGGSFTTVGGTRRNHAARLNADGSLELAFNPNVGVSLFTAVNAVVVQADGKILIGGSFSSVAGVARNRLARLNAAGTLDLSFNPNAGSWVNSMALQADGKIIAGGFFSTMGGVARHHLARVLSTGALDPAFDPNVDDHVYSLAMQGDGEVFAGGLFTMAGAVARNRFARFDNDAVVESLTATSANRLQWLRAGSAPEAQSVSFELSTNGGVSWSALGAGVRIAGGWEKTGITLPAACQVRALARVSSGAGNGSSGLVQTLSVLSFPVATTLAASAVSINDATLNGSVNAKGTVRDVTFEYGLTTAYGTTVTATPATVSGSALTPVAAPVSGLAAHTKYHFRVHAGDAMASVNGADMTFVTSNQAPVAVTDDKALLPGAVVVLPVLLNDTDGDGDTLSITAFSAVAPVSAGKVVKVGTTLVFTASSTFAGATFTYTATDGFTGTSTGTVNLTLGTCVIDPASPPAFAAAGTSYPVTVTATGAWSAIESLTWASVSPASGTGDGVVTVTLQPNAAKTARTGTINIGGQTHTINQAGVVLPVLAVPGVIPAAMVSASFNLTIPTTNAPVTYTVTRMPPGLTMNNATGVISGKPTAAGSYAMTVKAANAAGTSNTISFTLLVQPLPAMTVGTFHGFIARNTALNATRGSRLELVTTGNGNYSGKVITGVTSVAFAGVLIADASGATSPRCQFTKAGIGTLDVLLDPLTNTLAGTLTDGGVNTVAATGWRNAWTTTNKATAYKALHTFMLEQPDASTALPQGHGYGSFTVTETTGALTVSGKLADGNVFTTTTFIGQQGQVLIYQPLYNQLGSFAGTLVVTPGVMPADNTLAGTPTWLKPAAAAAEVDTLYRAGFGPIPLNADGGAYVPPAAGAVVLGMPNSANNAELQFTRGGLDVEGKEFDLTFSILNPSVTGLTNKVTIPVNTNTVTMPVLTPSTGAFSGEFTIAGNTSALNRKVAYQGLIVRRSGITRGYGFFLLPELPEGIETLATSPRNSGQMRLIDVTIP